MMLAVCPVDSSASGASATTCPEPLQYVEPASALSFADLGISAEGIGLAFGWGFAAVVLMWYFGFVIGVALRAIRKV